MTDPKTEKLLPYFVYTIFDPKDFKPFYVGMGQNTRELDHKAGEKDPKEKKIKEIKLRLQLSDDMREFAIINNLTEQDVIKIRDDKLIPEPHLGFLTALLKDKNLEFYKDDK